MPAEHVDVLIVGAGPAGLAAGAELRRLGIGSVLVVDREPEAGGIPRLCDHTGFGLYDLRRLYSGPAYARHYVRRAETAGVAIWPETTITGWQGDNVFNYTSPRGLGQIEAQAVLLATGCRERPRSARLVPGDRPPGVFTTGSLQRFLHEQHLPVGHRAVIVGAELVSLSALMALAQARIPIVRMVTELRRHQIYLPYLPAKWWLMDLWTRTPLAPRARVSRIFGRRRVEGIELTHLDDGRLETLECDTVVFTGDWIPENELARTGGLVMDTGTRGPCVDSAYRTTAPGIFAAGNLLRGAETADACALEGQRAARSVAEYLRHCAWPSTPIPVQAEEPIEWIVPNSVSNPAEPPPFGAFTFRVRDFVRQVRIGIYQGDRLLLAQTYREVQPNRTLRLGSAWLGAVALDGQPLRAALVR